MEESVGAARARYCVPSYSAGESRDLENLNYLFYTRGLDQSCHPPHPHQGTFGNWKHFCLSQLVKGGEGGVVTGIYW